MALSQKRKIFSDFFLQFVNLLSVLNIFQKMMTLIDDVFLNLRTTRDWG